MKRLHTSKKQANYLDAKSPRRWPALIGLVLGLCSGLPMHASQSVSIAWNTSSDSGVAGYFLYVGKSTTNYTTKLNVSTNTTVTLTGLTEGTTIYCAVTSYNSANLEGNQSAAVSYLVPGLLVMTPGGSGTNSPIIKFSMASGHSYQVQASTNLRTWTNIYQTPTATNNAWFSYQDPRAGSFSGRFYRLVMH
jgi:hypothetical protein